MKISNIKNIIKFKTNSSQNVNKNAKKEGEHERDTWTGRFDFFLTALGYAVGLGAVWRFPFLCYTNGGGAFLIPYFACLFLVGIPLVFLEMAVGQYTSSGPLTCWVMSPLFRGVGFSMNIVNNYVNIYFTMILVYSLYFLVLSLNSVLPWEKCSENFIQKNCVDDFDPKSFVFTLCNNKTELLKCDNGKCYNRTALNGMPAQCSFNETLLQKVGYWNPAYPSEIYWKETILQKSSGINDSGHLIWQLIVGLIVAWIIIWAMVIKGIKVSGKLVYFTALFPYLVLLILGIRGWLLPGADIGIKYYIYPDFSRLNDLKVWTAAASQIFFTLNVSYGGLLALASYNSFKTNILRDAITVSLANCATSVFAGFVVFAYMGYLSKLTGLDIDKVVQAGQGLAFVVYPFAVTTIKGAPFWSILFFLMMLVLGLDSSMGSVETFITSVFDLLPKLRQTNWKRYLTITLICFGYFMCGIIFCFQSGTYWIEFLDSYEGSWAIFLVAAAESISVGWFYGFNNFRNDLALMLGSKIVHNFFFNIFRLLWCFITPAIVIGLFVISVMNIKQLKTSDYEYPYWTLIVGNFVSASTLFGLIGWPIYMIIVEVIIKKKSFRSLLKPSKKWAPLKVEHKLNLELDKTSVYLENSSNHNGNKNSKDNI